MSSGFVFRALDQMERRVRRALTVAFPRLDIVTEATTASSDLALRGIQKLKSVCCILYTTMNTPTVGSHYCNVAETGDSEALSFPFQDLARQLKSMASISGRAHGEHRVILDKNGCRNWVY